VDGDRDRAMTRNGHDVEMPADDLTVLIPAFNEEEGIGPTLSALFGESRLRGARVIVIDDGSSDNTAEVASAFAGVQVLRHKNNLGYGAGIKTGTRHAETTWVAWFDADGQHRPQDLAEMLEAAKREHYDAVFGNRSAGSAVVKSRVVGKKVLGVVANSVANQKIPDINCGLRVFRRELLAAYLPLLPDGFSASTTTTLLFIKRNRHFSFHPVVTPPRVGTSTVKQVRDGMRTLHLMMRILFLFSAFKAFAIVAGVFLALGIGYGTTIALMHGQGFPVLAELLTLAGVITFCFGIVSDQISALRIDLLERSDAQARTR
jgi:glycosyltransferase involved in cell wall biosynthesis